MSGKNPVGKLAQTALSSLKDPKATAGKVMGQARTTVAFGRAVGSTAGAFVGHAAGKVGERLTGHRAPGGTTPPAGTTHGGLRAVPEVNEPAHTVTPTRGRPDSPKAHGDALVPEQAPATTAATAATTKKAATKKAATKKAATKKAATKKAATKKAPAKRPAAKTTAAKATPKTVAKKTTTKKAAPAPTPGEELPPTKVEGDAGTTPSGIPAADPGSNPDTTETDLTQPGTEPVVDPSTTKQVAGEAEKLRKAAEKDPD